MKFLIYSHEHLAYWKGNKFGYVHSANEAGRFTYEEAVKILKQANITVEENDAPNESLIPEEVALIFRPVAVQG